MFRSVKGNSLVVVVTEFGPLLSTSFYKRFYNHKYSWSNSEAVGIIGI